VASTPVYHYAHDLLNHAIIHNLSLHFKLYTIIFNGGVVPTFVIVVIVFFMPPSRQPHKWPKHAGGS